MPLVRCLCSAQIEARDGDALADAFLAHTKDVHADLKLSERRVQDALDAIRRTGGWDGERKAIDGDVEIRRLSPAMKDAYLAYFDNEAFSDNPAWASCYCLSYHMKLPPAEWEKRTAEQNRADRAAMIERGAASGVLATVNGKIAGWCNASPWESLGVLSLTPGFDTDEPEKTGAIVCYVIAPQYRGQGLARRLLDGACDLLRDEGLEWVDAYPPNGERSEAGSYHGRLRMYLDAGFKKVRELERYVVVRKEL